MKKFFLVLSVLLCVATTLSAQENGTQRSIEVNGYYEEEFTPDRIYIGFTLKENQKDKISVQQQQNQMVHVLKNLGVDIEKQLVVKDMFGNTIGKNPRKSVMLQTRNYELLLTNAESVSEVYEALQDLKVYSLRINRVELSTLEEEKIRIMGLAVKNARRVANVLAQSAGCQIYNVLQIVCNESLGRRTFAGDYVMLKSARGMNADSVEESAPTIEFRKITISSMVRVSYGIR